MLKVINKSVIARRKTTKQSDGHPEATCTAEALAKGQAEGSLVFRHKDASLRSA